MQMHKYVYLPWPILSDLHVATFAVSEVRFAYPPLDRGPIPGTWLVNLVLVAPPSLWYTGTVRPKCGNYVIRPRHRGAHCLPPSRLEETRFVPFFSTYYIQSYFKTTLSSLCVLSNSVVFNRNRFCLLSKWPGIPPVYGHTHTWCPYRDQVHKESSHCHYSAPLLTQQKQFEKLNKQQRLN